MKYSVVNIHAAVTLMTVHCYGRDGMCVDRCTHNEFSTEIIHATLTATNIETHLPYIALTYKRNVGHKSYIQICHVC